MSRKFWMSDRSGLDALVPISEERLRDIFLENGPDFSAEPAAAFVDLDPAALADFPHALVAQSPESRHPQLVG